MAFDESRRRADMLRLEQNSFRPIRRYSCWRLPFLSVPACRVLFVKVRQLSPEDLAEIAPGPELARVLAGLELSRLSGFDCVQVLKAQYRQANHERARVMAAMAEVGVCGPVPR